MKKINIMHFGIGNVGKELIKQILANKEKIKQDFGIDLQHCGLFNSKGGFFKKSGLSENEIKKYLIRLSHPKEKEPIKLIKKLPSGFLKNTIAVDTTTSPQMFQILSLLLKKGCFAVLANKRPLAGPVSEFIELHNLGSKRLKYETTVGAGLPVIKVLKELLATGDQILEINGCFSGTLGFICSSLEQGLSFSQSILQAMQKGYTEFDPREDLSGNDVARKAVILARIIGNNAEMDNLEISPLFPESYAKYTLEDFLKHVKELDEMYKKLFEDSLKKGMTLRFMASVSPKKCSIKLTEVPKNSPLGNLKGTDNMIVFKTKRYFERPIIIQGPGAGVEVTAAGVFADMLYLTGAI